MEAYTHTPEVLRNINTGMKINPLDSGKRFDSIEIELPITRRQRVLDYCWDHGYRITRNGPKINGRKMDKETYLIRPNDRIMNQRELSVHLSKFSRSSLSR